MKNIIQQTFWRGIAVGLFFSIMFTLVSPRQMKPALQAATLSKGVTFTTNQTVQYSDLNNLVDLATISGIVAADIANGAIGANQLAANAVTLSKMAAGSVDNTKIVARTLTSSLYATNSVDGIAMSTNVTYGAGTYSWTNNATVNMTNATVNLTGATVNFTNATLGFSANSIPVTALSAGGGSLVMVTNVVMTTDVRFATGNTYTNLISITTAASMSNGWIQVDAQAQYRMDAATSATRNGYRVLSIQGSSTNVIYEAGEEHGQNIAWGTLATHIGGFDTLTGTARTYVLQGKANAGDGTDGWTSTNVVTTDSYTTTNATQMTLINFKP